ncbi:uncharacterized protein ALTATR162_LOCUS6733 [Alternaria atra]|uniref:Uncharacterized protein n=1 Tax=Alternaria atra TaxID=119953 RepID=A0A8J2N0Z5_9PLEO|nr:uncharacterized protein ALTATR162_LOCUS6733 [Alternaria atra]CAG5164988.1 unnamed protein product [Alternaria atra]
MLPSALRSMTKRRAAGSPTPFALSTQTRTLYFCGPKPGDHDPDLPISQHYHARYRTTGSDGNLIAESPLTTPALPTPSAQPATSRISVTHIASLPERHTMPSTNKLETASKAIRQLEATTHDITTYNTATVIIREEIARLEVVLRRGEVEGKHWQELQRVRDDIEGLKSVSERMERRM